MTAGPVASGPAQNDRPLSHVLPNLSNVLCRANLLCSGPLRFEAHRGRATVDPPHHVALLGKLVVGMKLNQNEGVTTTLPPEA